MQKQCLGNNSYNVVHQLTKTLEFLNHVECYIKDSNKAGDTKAEEIWKKIKTDRESHADMLKELITEEVRRNRF